MLREPIHYLVVYFASLAAFLAIDLTWLGLIARGFYRDQLQGFLSASVNWPAALAFYALFVVGVMVFAILPGVRAESLGMTVALAALFGLIAYATYDLTNLATLKDWPWKLALVDMAWGAVLSSGVAVVGYLVAHQFRQ